MSNNPIIGYVFGYKTTTPNTQNGDNYIAVSFIHGVSDHYPEELENKNDFWFQEISEGDKTELFITLENMTEVFRERLKHSQENFETSIAPLRERNQRYQLGFTDGQLLILDAWMSSEFDFAPRRYETKQDRYDYFDELVGDWFQHPLITSSTSLDLYVSAMAQAYEDSLLQLTGDGSFKL